MTPQIADQASERLVDVGRGIELCVRTSGDEAGPPLLLVHGLAMQLIDWPQELVDAFGDAGFHVIRFDNRDIGRSTRMSTPPPNPLQLVRRRFSASQYELSDMADDTAGLIDALELGPVHAVGVSMGGMIAQTLAARHPEQVRSLVSIMSSTGSGKTGQPARSTWLRMARPPSTSKEASVNRTVMLFRHIGSPAYPFNEAEVRSNAEAAFDRAYDPAGPGRQIAAIMKSGSRTREVSTITAPTLVIHGTHDRMVHVSGGEATAAAISGARLETFAGMGHDFPAATRGPIAKLVIEHALAAQQATA